MAMSLFYRSIRERAGTGLLLMPAVAGIVRDRDGRLLLQQRHDSSWSLPAGAIEPGETPGVAVVREMLEETGLYVRASRIAGIVGGVSCRVRYANGDEVEYVVTVFDCEVIGGSAIESNEETRSLTWFRYEDMPELAFAYPRPMFDANQPQPYFESA
jgi:8-oxo-dGTP pyrophosphatase MutT (NUDIX family)